MKYSVYEKIRAQALTIVPLRLYERRGFIKLEIGLVRGKRKWEKREDLKKKTVRREIERAMNSSK